MQLGQLVAQKRSSCWPQSVATLRRCSAGCHARRRDDFQALGSGTKLKDSDPETYLAVEIVRCGVPVVSYGSCSAVLQLLRQQDNP